MTIGQLAEITKIKTDHIRALESGDYKVFAAPVYIRGFVRNCGKVLKVETGLLLASLDRELAESSEINESPRLTPDAGGILDLLMLQLSKVNWQVALPVLTLTLALLIALAGYRIWRSPDHKDPLANLEPALYTSPGTQSGDTLPLPLPTTTKK